MKKAPTSDQTSGAFGEQLTFLEPAPFCPSWPKRNSLADRALKLFLDGKVFDHPDFIEGFGSWRLSSVVHRLRENGWPIDTISVPAPNEESPGRTIALYKLPAKFIAEALALMAGEMHAR